LHRRPYRNKYDGIPFAAANTQTIRGNRWSVAKEVTTNNQNIGVVARSHKDSIIMGFIFFNVFFFPSFLKMYFLCPLFVRLICIAQKWRKMWRDKRGKKGEDRRWQESIRMQ